MVGSNQYAARRIGLATHVVKFDELLGVYEARSSPAESRVERTGMTGREQKQDVERTKGAEAPFRSNGRLVIAVLPYWLLRRRSGRSLGGTSFEARVEYSTRFISSHLVPFEQQLRQLPQVARQDQVRTSRPSGLPESRLEKSSASSDKLLYRLCEASFCSSSLEPRIPCTPCRIWPIPPVPDFHLDVGCESTYDGTGEPCPAA